MSVCRPCVVRQESVLARVKSVAIALPLTLYDGMYGSDFIFF